MLSELGIRALLRKRVTELEPLERYIYSGTIVVSVVMRFMLLGSAPLPFADELVAGADIRAQLQTGLHFYGVPITFYDWLTTFIDGRLLSGIVFGTSLLDIRIISAAFGVLSMAGLIWLGIEMQSLRLGVIAACMYGLMPWAIYFNRVFIPASEYGFLSLVGCCLLVRALRNHHFRSLYGAVFPLVIAIYLYPPALITSPGLAALFIFIYRKEIPRRYFKHILSSGLLGAVLLSYYAVVHYISPPTNLANADTVISGQGLWQHQLSVSTMITRFVTDWASYLNPSFLLVHGDPTTQRQTIGVLGEVGYVIGIFGLLGIINAIRVRSRELKLLIAALLLYPVADALTYRNANASSVVGFLGCIVWSVLAANGLIFVLDHGARFFGRGNSRDIVGPRNLLLLLSFCLLASQMAFFSWYYFVRYPVVAASNFEIGFPQTAHVLASHDAALIPLVLQGSYAENVILDYFDNNMPKVLGLYFSCSPLPYNAVHFTPSGVVIVIHESPAYEGTTGCVPGNQVISLDLSALKRAGRKFVVWGIFSNAPGEIYRTAVVFLVPCASTYTHHLGSPQVVCKR